MSKRPHRGRGLKRQLELAIKKGVVYEKGINFVSIEIS